MTFVRRHLAAHTHFAMLVVAMALMLRVLVPAGFMPVFSHGQIQITVCPGFAPAEMMADMPGMNGKSDHAKHDKGEMPCAFAALSAPSLSGADPIQLALAILFIFAAVLVAAPRFRLEKPERITPPLRGPPAAA